MCDTASGIALMIQAEQNNLVTKDPIVMNVIGKLAHRSRVGIEKYGTMMTRQDLTHRQWLQHAQEEAMDLAIYLERIIQDAK